MGADYDVIIIGGEFAGVTATCEVRKTTRWLFLLKPKEYGWAASASG